VRTSTAGCSWRRAGGVCLPGGAARACRGAAHRHLRCRERLRRGAGRREPGGGGHQRQAGGAEPAGSADPHPAAGGAAASGRPGRRRRGRSRRRPRRPGRRMTGAWGLPTQAVIEDRVYEIHSDYRDILELLRWLDGTADPALDRGERWYVAMRLFYPDFAAMPRQDWPAATRFLTEFLAA